MPEGRPMGRRRLYARSCGYGLGLGLAPTACPRLRAGCAESSGGRRARRAREAWLPAWEGGSMAPAVQGEALRHDLSQPLGTSHPRHPFTPLRKTNSPPSRLWPFFTGESGCATCRVGFSLPKTEMTAGPGRPRQAPAGPGRPRQAPAGQGLPYELHQDTGEGACATWPKGLSKHSIRPSRSSSTEEARSHLPA